MCPAYNVNTQERHDPNYAFELMISTTIVISISDLFFSFGQALTGRFQASSTHQEPVNIFLLCQVPTIFLVYWSTVYHAGLVRSFLGYGGGEPFSDWCVHLLSLLCGCNFPRTNCPSTIEDYYWKPKEWEGGYKPDWFISNDNLWPIFCPIPNSLQLGGDNFNCFITLSLLRMSNSCTWFSKKIFLTSRVSPTQRITLNPPSKAAAVLLAINYYQDINLNRWFETSAK